jgi:hypothetical protein
LFAFFFVSLCFCLIACIHWPGFFKLEALSENPDKYEGTTAHDITSANYGGYRVFVARLISSIPLILSRFSRAQGVRLSAMTGSMPGVTLGGKTTFPEGEEVFFCVQCKQRYGKALRDVLL